MEKKHVYPTDCRYPESYFWHIHTAQERDHRVATAQGKQGIWFLLFPDRENTGNFALAQGKILRLGENIFL